MHFGLHQPSFARDERVQHSMTTRLRKIRLRTWIILTVCFALFTLMGQSLVVYLSSPGVSLAGTQSKSDIYTYLLNTNLLKSPHEPLHTSPPRPHDDELLQIEAVRSRPETLPDTNLEVILHITTTPEAEQRREDNTKDHPSVVENEQTDPIGE
jgi:hypothetical protein